MASTPNGNKPRLYFGYGSNLWKEQMLLRCPTSSYMGIARLNGYRWIINERGYANVVETFDSTKSPANEVWGLVFSLQPSDEDKLDVNEGVPEAYTKEDLEVEFWSTNNGDAKPEVTQMLVYIDRKRLEPDVPKKEYIYRMNRGVADALEEGVPVEYVNEVVRKFIPDLEDESVAKFARQQAIVFEEER